MTFLDAIVTFSILFGIFLIVYTKVRNQTMKETIDEVKEVVNPVDVYYPQ